MQVLGCFLGLSWWLCMFLPDDAESFIRICSKVCLKAENPGKQISGILLYCLILLYVLNSLILLI